MATDSISAAAPDNDAPLEMVPHVKVGEELTLHVIEYGQRGDGVAKDNGLVIFIPGTKVGDTVDVQITKVAAHYAVARRLS